MAAEAIIRTDPLGTVLWQLVSKATGAPVLRGTAATTFRGESVVVVGGRPPHKPSSTGRIYCVRPNDPSYVSEWFPSVCDLTWEPYPES